MASYPKSKSNRKDFIEASNGNTIKGNGTRFILKCTVYKYLMSKWNHIYHKKTKFSIRLIK